MSVKRILSIGQCAADHAGIGWFLKSHFDDVHVDAAASEIEALAALERQTYDLVLVNRLLDRDHSSGIEIIRRLKANDRFKLIPAMLVSNYADAQRQAEAAGALPGFGKSELDAATADRLRISFDTAPKPV